MTKTNKKTVRLVLMALLSAIIIMLTCLPLRTMGFEITLAVIPIAVGAVVLGPVCGAILGGVYGICSFLQCLGLLLPSPLGMGLIAINPVFTAITCIVPRVLCGLFAGLVYKALKNIDKTNFLSHSLACLTCPLLNTVFFMSSLMIFFGQTELMQGFMDTLGVYNPLMFVLAFVGINGLVEAIACFVIATAVAKTLTLKRFHLT